MTPMLLHLALSAAMAAGTPVVPVAYVAPMDAARAIQGRTMVEVDNQNFDDATVYVVQGLRSVRLGRVTGLSRAEFALPPEMVVGAQSVRFVIRPLASRRNSVSQEIVVSQGDVVGLIIPPF